MLRFRRDDMDDRGVSLVEMLITMSLTLVLGSILATAVIGSDKLFRTTRNESVGQTDIRTTIERLGRDVRNARALDAGANDSKLVLWIDSNSDYKKQSTEIVTWSLVLRADLHYDVARTVNGKTSRTARFVISDLAFNYRARSTDVSPLPLPLSAADAASVRIIGSDILYRVETKRIASTRHTVFSERLRNVA